MFSKFGKYLLIILVIFLTSCSDDDSETGLASQILGTWERVTINNNETTTYRLVFSGTNEGVEIYRITDQNDMDISSANEFVWDYDGNATVTFNTTVIYNLTTNEGVLQLENGTETPIVKISDEYLY